MSERRRRQADYDAIKTACKLAVEAIGTVSLAARLTRAHQSHLSKAISRDWPDSFPCADQILDFEDIIGEPVITQVFADLAGYDLVPRETKPLASVRSLIAAVTREIADIPAKYIEAEADHHLSEKERIAIRLEAEQAIDKLNALRAALAPERHVRAVK